MKELGINCKEDPLKIIYIILTLLIIVLGIMFTSLDIDIKIARKQAPQALQLADAMRKQFPISRVAARQYADALTAAKRYDEAVAYLRDQAQLYRSDAGIQTLLAKAYAAQGKQALQHLALADEVAVRVRGCLFLEKMRDGARHLPQWMARADVHRPVGFPLNLDVRRLLRQGFEGRKVGFHLNIHGVGSPAQISTLRTRYSL